MNDSLVDFQPLGERAYRELEDRIVTGRLAPGTPLSEARLAASLGLGRTPVREALQRLAREGLVTILPRRGVLVTEINLVKHLKVLELRGGVEILVARHAASRATPAQRQRMREVADAVEAAAAQADEARFLELAREFHNLPVEAADNAYFDGALTLVHGLVRRFWFLHQRGVEDMVAAARVHADRLRAIADGDPANAERATQAMNAFFEEFALSMIGPRGGGRESA